MPDIQTPVPRQRRRLKINRTRTPDKDKVTGKENIIRCCEEDTTTTFGSSSINYNNININNNIKNNSSSNTLLGGSLSNKNTNINSKELTFLKQTPTNLPVSERFLKKNTPPQITKSTETLLQVWYDFGLRKHINQISMTFREDVRSLNKFSRGTLFIGTEFEHWEKQVGKFSPLEFERSVECFHVMATNLSYYPKDKDRLKRMSISDFLYNPNHTKITSYFLHCLTNPPKLIVSNSDDPELMETMMKMYVEEFGEGIVFDLSQSDINHFAIGSNLAKTVFEKSKIPKELIDTPEKKARLIFDAIYSYSRTRSGGNRGELHIPWFSNPLTYNKSLVNLLKLKIHRNVVPINKYIYR